MQHKRMDVNASEREQNGRRYTHGAEYIFCDLRGMSHGSKGNVDATMKNTYSAQCEE